MARWLDRAYNGRVLFPIRDSIPSRITPIVTTGIIVACGLTFVYELFVGANLPALFDIAGFIPDGSSIRCPLP